VDEGRGHHPTDVLDNVCRRSCVASPADKFRYAANTKYTYELQSQSEVTLGGRTNTPSLDWTARVELMFASPCEVVLVLTNVKENGKDAPSLSRDLSQHPIRAIYKDGTFGNVCVDPRDSSVAVNIKKGILSALQNTLPSNSTIHDGLALRETDILGGCPTLYKVNNVGEELVIKKVKDHQQCTGIYSMPSQSTVSSAFIKSPAPVVKSESTCVQHIKKGIITSVVCNDAKEVITKIGNEGKIHSEQKSTLKLLSSSTVSHVPLIGNTRRTNLIHDFTSKNKNSSAIPELENKIKKIKQLLSKSSNQDEFALDFSEVIVLMDQVPEQTVKDMLYRIRNQYFGSDTSSLEQIYLDAVAATSNTGAIEVMVDEILSENRVLEYTFSLFSMKRVSRHGVKALIPLFIEQEMPVSVLLAAGTAIGTYCNTEGAYYTVNKIHGGCVDHHETQEVMQIISHQLSRQCSIKSKLNTREVKRTIALLKAVANIKEMNEQLTSVVLACVEDQSVDNNVKIAAANALKSVSCDSLVSEKLNGMARDVQLNTEVRIAAYKSSIECSNATQIRTLLDTVKVDANEQVNSYVLSDMKNLQLSSSPEKKTIRDLLLDFDIPKSHFPRKSSNYKLSKFSEKFGSEIDFDVIFDDYNGILPKQLKTNITIEMFDELINVAEMGIRVTDLPEMLRKFVREGTTLGNTALGNLIRLKLESLPKNHEEKQIEYFIKVFGQEIIFDIITSLNDEKTLWEMYDETMESILMTIMKRSVKGTQWKFDYQIPSMQGTPLILSQELSLVTRYCLETPNEMKLDVSPSISTLYKTFAGFEFGPSIGITSETKLSSTGVTVSVNKVDNVLSIKVEMPNNELELLKLRKHHNVLSVKTENRLQEERMGAENSENEQSIDRCRQVMTNMELCHEFSSQHAATERSKTRIVLKSSRDSARGFEIKFITKKQNEGFQIDIQDIGSTKVKKMSLDVEYMAEGDHKFISIVSTTGISSNGVKVQLDTNQNNIKTLKFFTELKNAEDHGEEVLSATLSLNATDPAFGLKTYGRLRRAVDIDVVFSMEKKELQRLEVSVNTGAYKLQSYVRRGSDRTTLESFIHLQSHGRNVMKFHSRLQFQLSERGLSFQKRFDLELRQTVIQGILEVLKTDELLKYDIEMKTNKLSSDGLTMKSGSDSFTSSLYWTGAEIRLSGQLQQLPRTKLKVVAVFQIPGEKSGSVDVSVNSKDQEVLSVKGPITIVMNSHETQLDTNLGLRLPHLPSSYMVECTARLTHDESSLAFIVRNESRELFEFLHEISRKDWGSKFTSVIRQANNWDTEVRYSVKTPYIVHVSANLRVPLLAQRRVKGDVNYNPGHVSAKLQWDVEREPLKLIAITGDVTADASHRGIQGKLRYGHSEYPFIISSYSDVDLKYPSLGNIFKFEMKKGNAEYIVLSSVCNVNFISSSQYNIEISGEVKTPSKMQNTLKYIGKGDGSTHRNHASLDLENLGNTEIEFNLDNSYLSQKKIINNIVITYAPARSHSPTVEVSNVLITKYQEDGSFKDIYLVYQVKALENDYFMKLTAIKEHQAKFSAKATLTRTCSQERSSDCQPLSSDVSALYSGDVKSISIYPSTENMNHQYSLSYSGDESSDKILLLQFHHEGRQKTISAALRQQDQQTDAELQFHLLPQHQSNAAGFRIRKTGLRHGVTRIVVETLSHEDEKRPKLIIETVTTSSEQSAVMTFERYQGIISHQGPVSLSIKYLRQTPTDGTLSAILSVQDKHLEVGGAVSKLSTHECEGYRFNGTMALIKEFPHYLQLTSCSPAFVNVIAGRKGSPERYIAKAGLRGRTTAEISLKSLTQETTLSMWHRLTGATKDVKQQSVMALSAMVADHKSLVLDVELNREHARQHMHVISTTISSTTRRVCHLLDEAFSIITESVRLKDASSADALAELSRIISHGMQSSMLRHYTALVTSSVCNAASRAALMLSAALQHTHAMLRSAAKTELMQHYIDAAKGALAKYMKDIAPSGPIRNLILEILEFVKSVGDRLIDAYCPFNHDVCRAVKFRWDYFMDHLIDFFTPAIKALMSDESFIKMKYELKHHVDMLERREYMRVLGSLLGKTAGIGLETRPHGGMKLTLPLSQPVTSLLYAPRHIGFSSFSNKISEDFYIKGKKEIITPTHLNLDLPVTNCEYLLVGQDSGITVTMGNMSLPSAYIQALDYSKDKMEMQLYLDDQRVIVNGIEKKDKFWRLVLAQGYMTRSDDFMVYEVANVKWVVMFNRHLNKLEVAHDGGGIFYHDFTGEESHQDLLRIFEDYKMDSQCQESPTR